MKVNYADTSILFGKINLQVLYHMLKNNVNVCLEMLNITLKQSRIPEIFPKYDYLYVDDDNCIAFGKVQTIYSKDEFKLFELTFLFV